MNATSAAVSLPLPSSKNATMGAFAVPELAPKEIVPEPKTGRPELAEIEITIAITSARTVLETANRAIESNAPLPNSLAVLLDKNKVTLGEFKNRLAQETVTALNGNDKEKQTSLRAHIDTIDKLIEDIKKTKEKLLVIVPTVKSVIDGISKKEVGVKPEKTADVISIQYSRPPKASAPAVNTEKNEVQKPVVETALPPTNSAAIFENRFASSLPNEVASIPAPKANKMENSLPSVIEAISIIETLYTTAEERLIPPGTDPLIASKKIESGGIKEEFIFNQLSNEEKKQILTFTNKSDEVFAEEVFFISKEVYGAIAEKTQEAGFSPYNILHDENLPGLYITLLGQQTDVRKEASIIIQGISDLVKKLNISNPGPREIGKETLEQFMSEKRYLITEELKRGKII